MPPQLAALLKTRLAAKRMMSHMLGMLDGSEGAPIPTQTHETRVLGGLTRMWEAGFKDLKIVVEGKELAVHR